MVGAAAEMNAAFNMVRGFSFPFYLQVTTIVRMEQC